MSDSTGENKPGMIKDGRHRAVVKAAEPSEVGKRRRRATIQAAAMAAVGGIVIRYFNHMIVGVVLLSLGAVVAIGGWLFPPVFRWTEKLTGWLVQSTGVVLTWILLVPFYYLCFGVGRILTALGRHDPLQLRFPSPRPTFWIDQRLRTDADRYKKQS